MWRGFLAAVLLAIAGPPADAEPPPHADWALTFQDDFEGQGVNWEVWDSDHASRGVNKLEGRWPENNIVKDGVLYQSTKREVPPRGGNDWSTAHIWTRAFQQQYGYFEARMRYGRYLNNAFWVFRPRCARFPDPPHFEIDINEGHTPREVAMCLHFYDYSEGEKECDLYSTGKKWDAPMDLDKDFHLYGVEWNEKEIIWYFDGQPIRRVEASLCHAPADVRLSTVIMPGQLEKDGVKVDTMDGVSMAVDWVRVYRKTRDLSTPEKLPELEKFGLPKVVERPPQVDRGKTKTVLLQEDFESPEANGLPARWEVGDKSPRVVPDQAQGGKAPLAPGNKVLRLSPDDYIFRLFDRPVTGRLEAEFDYWSPHHEGLLFVTLGDFDKTNPERLKTSYYTGDIGPYIHWNKRFIWYYTEQEKWTPFAVRKRGAWNRVRIVCDVSKGVFDCYVGDGLSKFLGGGIFRHRQKAAKGIGLRHRGLKGTVFVDNVIVRALTD
jgi:beta-glucanase (GH16 family)